MSLHRQRKTCSLDRALLSTFIRRICLVLMSLLSEIADCLTLKFIHLGFNYDINVDVISKPIQNVVNECNFFVKYMMNQCESDDRKHILAQENRNSQDPVDCRYSHMGCPNTPTLSPFPRIQPVRPASFYWSTTWSPVPLGVQLPVREILRMGDLINMEPASLNMIFS